MKKARIVTYFMGVILLLFFPVWFPFAKAIEVFEFRDIAMIHDIQLDGRPDEQVWEGSRKLDFTLDGDIKKSANIKMLMDIEYLYLLISVSDPDRGDFNEKPDRILFKLQEGANTKEFSVSHTGELLTGYGIFTGISENKSGYQIEMQIPFKQKWKTIGKFYLTVSVVDNQMVGEEFQKTVMTKKDIITNVYPGNSAANYDPFDDPETVTTEAVTGQGGLEPDIEPPTTGAQSPTREPLGEEPYSTKALVKSAVDLIFLIGIIVLFVIVIRSYKKYR